jgi:hypothetical protein
MSTQQATLARTKTCKCGVSPKTMCKYCENEAAKIRMRKYRAKK